MSDTKPITIHVCGPSNAKCKCECGVGPLDENGRFRCEHVWDGPEISFDQGRGSSASCSRCGMSAYHHAMFVAP